LDNIWKEAAKHVILACNLPGSIEEKYEMSSIRIACLPKIEFDTL
jgi:hypothetical protein